MNLIQPKGFFFKSVKPQNKTDEKTEKQNDNLSLSQFPWV